MIVGTLNGISAVLMRRSHLFPDATPKDYYWTMRYIVNRRNELVKNLGGVTRQFHEQLQVAYPSYKQFFHELTWNTSLAFYEKFPLSEYLENILEKELGTFLRGPSHNTCSTNRARKILDLVAQGQQATLDYQQERDCLVRSIAQQIRFILRKILTIEKLETKMYQKLGYQLGTIPGVNIVTVCSLIAYIGGIHRFFSPHKLANYAGVAPLHFGSKGKDVQNKSQGNRNLYSTLYLLAIQQIYLTNKGEARNPVYHFKYDKRPLDLLPAIAKK